MTDGSFVLFVEMSCLMAFIDGCSIVFQIKSQSDCSICLSE